MTPPDFWYEPAGWKSRLLAPFGQLYRAVGILRRAIATPYRPAVPLICVGNIVAGGAGKTPVAIAVAELLKQHGSKPVFVSRGYGGTKLGPLFIEPNKHTAHEVGDEALLLANKAPCWIGRNRASVVRIAESHATHIIMDDGLQNPTVAPHFSILVINGETGLGNNQLIPAGPLRETLEDALKRTHVVAMVGEDKHNISANINIPILRARMHPCLPDNFPRDKEFLAFSGIAHPDKFYATCREAGLNIVETCNFPDHYFFSTKDLTALAERAHTRNLRLITTTKDAIRLPLDFRTHVEILSAELVFEDEVTLLQMLQSSTTALRLPS